MPIEQNPDPHAYVNAFTDAMVPRWLEVGANPFLDAGDVSFIWDQTAFDLSGVYSWPVSAGSGVINSVKLRLRVKSTRITVLPNTFVYWKWAASAGWSFGVALGISSAGVWYYRADIDMTAGDPNGINIDTWAKINSLQIYFEILQGSGVTFDYISEAIRVVDYTPTAARVLGDGSTFMTYMLRRQLPPWTVCSRMRSLMAKRMASARLGYSF